MAWTPMGPPRHALWVAPRPHMRNDTRATTRARSDSIAPTSTAASAARGGCRQLEGSQAAPTNRPEQSQLAAAALRAA
eukprot:3930519-Prymnesium_polylepis.1